MLLKKDPFNLIVTGVGGQGNVLGSQILGEMLVQKGYVVTIGETYGASQRGGSVMSHVRISKRDHFSPLIPKGQCDFVIALEPVEAVRVLEHYGNPNVRMLVNTRPIHPIDVIAGNSVYPEVSVVLKKIRELSRRVWTLNATEIATQLGDPIFCNITMLGALSALELFPLDKAAFLEVIEEILPTYRVETNLLAFERGQEAIRQANP